MGVHAPSHNPNLPRSPVTSTNPLALDRRPAMRHSLPTYCARCATSSTTMSGATDYIQQYGLFRYCSFTYGAHHGMQPPTHRASRSWTKRSATCTRNPTDTSYAATLTGFHYRSPFHNLAARVYPMPPCARWPALEESQSWKTNWFDDKVEPITKYTARNMHQRLLT
ncbi:hypothetical protein COCC4DRAFT_66621 [Bipolaris maydis ATCC 48331]|uniref:Uncharacterized protein n=3 Tax=Cochliobolus heterostrophus TaxID=5016 RepID=M2UB11_COCH5|nr:uncharacterized protein COCC4DRAFT_66621 [Bipolaris maydis ATCC 48331]EMD85137.1 hypothetical protein COCHEDRAFT_1035795 [Bipolaris maydis C5]ENH99200.1 hypothetical protein COCC4DRAFT_66621 [Bipolaris maydis ATCC 48331]